MNHEYFIYSLSCPSTGYVKYVGCTIDVEARYNNHRTSSQNAAIRQWVSGLAGNPVIEVLETVSEKDMYWAESFWIQQMQVWGFDLLNRRATLSNPYKIPVPYIPKRRPPTGRLYHGFKNLICRGDIKAIASEHNLHPNVVAMVMNHGAEFPGVEEKIIAFYRKKYKSLFGNDKSYMSFYFPKFILKQPA